MADYQSLREEQQRELGSLIPEHMQRLRWNAEQVAKEQERALRELVTTAKARSPWYAARLASVDHHRLRLSDLPTIPSMTKDELMSNFDGAVTDPRLSLDVVESFLDGLEDDSYLLDDFHAVASGGSSGRRGVFVYDWYGWIRAFLSMQRWRLSHLASLGIGRDAVRAVVAGGKATHMSFAMARSFGGNTNVVPVPASLPLAEIVERLNDVRPVILSGYPSMVAALAHEQAAGRLKIGPQVVWCASEPLAGEMRELISEVWGVPLINSYATSEGAFASDCGAGRGLHLSEDMCIFEPVDETGRPVAPGQRATKMYITPLYNLAQPLIRYEMTDEITLLEDVCSCGSGMRLIDDIGGRSDDMFRYDGVVVHPMAFRSPLGRRRNIVEYQVVQTQAGADVAIRTQGDIDLTDLQRTIESELARLGLPKPEVTIRQVESLDRQGTGKLRRFVPMPSP